MSDISYIATREGWLYLAVVLDLFSRKSDRGSQYTSEDFKRKTDQHEIILSMSSKGNSYDNAVVESFFHSLKTEHANFCKFKIKEEAVDSLFE
ncbi:Integrase core domain [Candidatus Rhabdochlamydia oedothoracis]|uniref:Integrase core domain n=1 Tax=Candidatus Rhabdochlamydia oedothoracis TaxID=2720720 RepID=A0ABX8V246_9BACT|nr:MULTISPECIES: DDE-type integrase/transposase/recombinase [Rhabdochlamydia]KAG6559429.1 hypothetical protein RHOW815_000550 [Candidatus Rhabdochlamydia sp. W815]QYF49264.1 Integrase core domain [Candidatus Rhabdochlamydia oedothoracis]